MKNKKFILPLTLALILPCITSCGENRKELVALAEGTLPTSTTYSSDTKLIFSEYFEGSGSDDKNRALEIYNFSDETVDLSEYEIYYYTKAGANTIKPTSSVKLSGTLEAKKTYVIVSDTATTDLWNKGDASTTIRFRGKQSLALAHNGKVVDVLGNIGKVLDWGKDTTYVRKVDHLNPETLTDDSLSWDSYSWIEYGVDNMNYLGNVENSVTPEELLLGPQIDNSYFQKDFLKYGDNNVVLGNGGAILSTLSSAVDGDTAKFSHPKTVKLGGKSVALSTYVKSDSVRFEVIDTAESYSGNIQEYGYVAKEFTGKLLKSAEEIAVVSNVGGKITETYGRMMGFVFVHNAYDVKGNDYRGKWICSNFLTTLNGYSEKCNTGDLSDELVYKDVPYASYFNNAFAYAKKNKLGLFSDDEHKEIDPYWDYSSNSYNGKEIDWSQLDKVAQL
jgi:endonuclease YncB( thermonuclease family)